MFNVDKNINIPKSLAREKLINGRYSCDDVITQLKNDFFEKCYLCEAKLCDNEITIDHFMAHLGDTNKKFNWANLFLCCRHCNNIKDSVYNNSRAKDNTNILDCTNSEDKVYDWIEYGFKQFPKPEVVINEKNDAVKVKNTINLLNKIYSENRNSKTRTAGAWVIKNKISGEMAEFITCLEHDPHSSKVRDSLSRTSPFSAFKRQIIKNIREYSALKKYFD